MADTNGLCHDCACAEGAIHKFGCDNEMCPFCGCQLLSCFCCYHYLNLIDHEKYKASNCYLSPEIYDNGLSKDQERQWEAILYSKGRLPYIQYAVSCAKCAKLWPDFFMVPDEEWNRYIQPDMRDKVICKECFDTIKELVTKHNQTDI